MERYYAQEEQKIRRKEVIRKTVENLECTFDEEGRLLGGTLPHSLRLMLHVAMTYLWDGSEKKEELANKILNAYLPDQEFCYFSPFLCIQLFFHCSDRLDYKAMEKMDQYCLRWVDAFLEPEMEGIGCNDNFPLMAAGTLLGCGLRQEREDYLYAAAKRIDQFDKLLKRRGFTSEYTSNTYTPIQALCFSEIAEFSKHPEKLTSRKLSKEQKELLDRISRQALHAEERVHLDLLGHMHWETAQLGGASSRGYARDVMAATSHARFLYYMLYGDQLTVDPLPSIMRKDGEAEGRISNGDEDFLRLMFAWHAMAQYHCPYELGEWAMHKKYPFTLIGSSECVSGRDLPPMDIAPAPSSLMPDYWEYPEHVNQLTTYMTGDYCLGTARYGWLGGMQSHNLQLLYRKQKTVRSQSDVGAMFTRYVINDHEIFTEKGNVSWEMGVCVTQQKENTAIALYSPRLLYDKDITSLKLTVNFTDLFEDGVDEIWIGEHRLYTMEGASVKKECVYVKTGEIYVCLIPLVPEAENRNRCCIVRRVKKLLEISFYNYRGEAKSFERMALGRMANGVAVEVRSAEEYADFEAFRKAMKPVIDDYMFEYYGRAVRKLHYENDGKILENEYSPLSLEMRYAMENNEPVLEPRLFSSKEDITKYVQE